MRRANLKAPGLSSATSAAERKLTNRKRSTARSSARLERYQDRLAQAYTSEAIISNPAASSEVVKLTGPSEITGVLTSKAVSSTARQAATSTSRERISRRVSDTCGVAKNLQRLLRRFLPAELGGAL